MALKFYPRCPGDRRLFFHPLSPPPALLIDHFLLITEDKARHLLPLQLRLLPPRGPGTVLGGPEDRAQLQLPQRPPPVGELPTTDTLDIRPCIRGRINYDAVN
uniref:Uncharacterized protein n=1 Tax=Timema poppense TaxID=170557 RepID=A0A7R9HES9_TIMPO|nr:unnamed protein product [Timema poppensis]